MGYGCATTFQAAQEGWTNERTKERKKERKRERERERDVFVALRLIPKKRKLSSTGEEWKEEMEMMSSLSDSVHAFYIRAILAKQVFFFFHLLLLRYLPPLPPPPPPPHGAPLQTEKERRNMHQCDNAN
jgi:hypothetical protein